MDCFRRSVVRLCWMLCLLGFLLPPQEALALAGWAEWQATSPGGFTVCSCDPPGPDTAGTVLFDPVTDEIYIKNIRDFKFYHGYISGETSGAFFLFNESSRRVEYFKTRADLIYAVRVLNPDEYAVAERLFVQLYGYLLIPASGLFLAYFLALGGHRRRGVWRTILRLKSFYLASSTAALATAFAFYCASNYTTIEEGPVLEMNSIFYIPLLISINFLIHLGAGLVSKLLGYIGTSIIVPRSPDKPYWLAISYGISWIIILSATVGRHIIHNSPYWNPGL